MTAAALLSLPVLLPALLTTAVGLYCLQCDSRQSMDCVRGDVPPTLCPEENSTYCITYSGYWEEGDSLLLTRNCSTVDFKESCHRIPVDNFHERNNTDVLVCYRSCDSDGCNDRQPQFPYWVNGSGVTHLDLSLLYTLIAAYLTAAAL